MSTTNDLACEDCREYLWVGQRDYIYSGEENIENLRKFLQAHKNHRLTYYTADCDTAHEDFKEFEAKP